MAKPYAAAASEAHVAAAARQGLERGWNAADAVLAGVLAAAAESPGVWLGPLQMLAAGGGAGLLAIDGRTRQPGLGIPRPRGALAGKEVPMQARVAVPGLPYALAAAHGGLVGASASLLAIASPAVARARSLSPERAAVLDLFARRGAAAMEDESFAGDLVAAAGRSAGGALTREDLASVRPAVVAGDGRAIESAGGLLPVPWRAAGADGRWAHVVVAADGRGLVVAACYECHRDDGMPLPAVGLVAPLAAVPVRRGEPRVRPGEPLAAAAPIALRVRRGICDLAAGVARTTGADAELELFLRAMGDSATFSEAMGAVGAGRVVAIARPDDLPVVVRSS